MTKQILAVYAVYLVIVSLVAFVMYKIDKVKAEKKKWRIRESTLLLSGFLGGAAGALAGMEVFRHKTKHWYFWAVNIAGLLWQAGLLVYLIIRFI
ncbi:MAG: DUF1294 domain-containing protein [Ruminococcus sp.]|nr:DUF1294 domain-containing protein [Ruminococcus sp.]